MIAWNFSVMGNLNDVIRLNSQKIFPIKKKRVIESKNIPGKPIAGCQF